MSRNIGLLATVIAVLLSIAACVDGPTGQSEDIDIMGRKLVPPPPQRVVFSFSLIGTTWEFSYVGISVQTATVDFLEYGRFHQWNIKYLSPEKPIGSDTTPDDDEWEQYGESVLATQNDGYATWVGTLSGDFMYGTDSNILGASWTWTAIRLR